MIIFEAVFLAVHPDIYKPEVAPYIVDAIGALDDMSAAVTFKLAVWPAERQAETDRN